MQPNLKHFHPFGCPVYVLQAPLQTRSPFQKWGEHSRLGIFLCHSPHHASSVPFVLSTQTGLVSPQFHCVFDDDFDTVKKEQADMSIWKIKAHLQEAKEKVLEKSTRSSLVSALQINWRRPCLPTVGTSLRHTKTCPIFFQTSPLQRTNRKNLPFLQLRNQHQPRR